MIFVRTWDRCPGSEIRNEDTEFGRRVMAAGEHLWYEPSAVVYHAVPENRLTKGYLLRFWFDHGRASIEKPIEDQMSGRFQDGALRSQKLPDRAPFEGVQLVIVNQSKAEILFQGLCMDDSWPDEGNVPSVHKRTKPINESRCISKKQYN